MVFYQELNGYVTCGCKTLTLCMLGNFSCSCSPLLTFFKIKFFKKLFQEHYQCVKQFGSKSGPTYCQSCSGSKLFAKVIGRGHVVTSREKVNMVMCK